MIEFKRKKRVEDRARESREAKEKLYEDYPWADLCEDVTKLKKLRLPELNKYLNHHGLKQHLKSSKSEKVKAIVRHGLQQMNPLRPAQTGLRDETQNDNMSDSSEVDESDHDMYSDEYESDVLDSEGEDHSEEEDESNDVILAFIAADEEVTDERRSTIRSGRAISRRSEIDFSFF